MKSAVIILFSIFFIINNLQAQAYEHNIEVSLNLAQEESKNVLMIFSGSDWCKPCIQLRKTILDSEDFQNFSSEKLVLLELDFPYSKKKKLSKEQTKHNESLADQYNPEGAFPKMVLLDNAQNTLGIVQYKKKYTSEEIIDQIEKLTK